MSVIQDSLRKRELGAPRNDAMPPMPMPPTLPSSSSLSQNTPAFSFMNPPPLPEAPPRRSPVVAVILIVLLLAAIAAAVIWGLSRSGIRLPFPRQTGSARVHTVTWPRFEIKGMGGASNGSSGIVMIGKEWVEVGSVSRQGIRVVEIRDQSVVLEFEGEQRVCAVGEGER
ncbi:MAG: hypothetical protein KBA51_07065 [Kiritimatiellae bacterium]|nr:hypothetical protein [Kiritimatiellia bacterium]